MTGTSKTRLIADFRDSLVADNTATNEAGLPLVEVTNHYITREDHPCYGTRLAAVLGVSTRGIRLDPGDFTEWPKARDLRREGESLVFWGYPNDGDRFLTITPVEKEIAALEEVL